MLNIFYLILAALGLGLLIFIHELGHYWMARREGMIVEVFSIGFGKPFRTWERKGVRWQICYLPFGGYVRIAGMEKKGALEPHQIPGGFYAQSPCARIRVALMGPCVNIVFALLAFTAIWVTGGRLKNFSTYTQIIGQVNPRSTLYAEGIRSGDEIVQLNGESFHGFTDLLYAAMLDDAPLQFQGNKIDYWGQTEKPFSYQYAFREGASGMQRSQAALQLFSPAQYLIYRGGSWIEDAPMKESGIQPGDRIVWVDGSLIFSLEQLVALINEPRALLTVRRGEKTFVTRAPRIPLADLRMDGAQREEMGDWQHAAQIEGSFLDVYFIPYNLTETGEVETPISFINEQSKEQMPESRSVAEVLLEPGDQILAVDGKSIRSSQELFLHLQRHEVQIVVYRGRSLSPISWTEGDTRFRDEINWKDLHAMVNQIGTEMPVGSSSDLYLLKPVVPKPKMALAMPQPVKDRYEVAHEAAKKQAENAPESQRIVQALERHHHRLALGILLEDQKVWYNPAPLVLFKDVVRDVYRTLAALVMGYVSPKQMAGPVGIIQVMQVSWSESFKEALFWMGMISLNLGLFNLLPVPVLDGGHICFALWESATKKPIKSKTMERLVVPFVVLLIAFFIYVTYHDFVRLLRFFQP